MASVNSSGLILSALLNFRTASNIRLINIKLCDSTFTFIIFISLNAAEELCVLLKGFSNLTKFMKIISLPLPDVHHVPDGPDLY